MARVRLVAVATLCVAACAIAQYPEKSVRFVVPQAPGSATSTWTGVIAPAGLPRPVLDKLNAAVNAAIRSPLFVERASIGDEPASGTPEEFAELIRVDSAKWADVVRRSGAQID